MRKTGIAAAIAAVLVTPAYAAPDWDKVPARTLEVFYPGVASLEWILDDAYHDGARNFRRGKSCVACHADEVAMLGKKTVGGEKAEPNPGMAKGRAASIPVRVQAAIENDELYVRFQWKPTVTGQKRIDEKSAAKISVMLDAGKVEYANLAGCWAACHDDLRSMPDVDPGAKDHPRAKELEIRGNGPTKYLKESRTGISTTKPRGGWDKLKPAAEYEAMIKDGTFLEMWQWRSGDTTRSGTVADARRMKAAKDLAEGRLEDGTYTVVFRRKLAGGPGVHELVPGRTYNIGFAIHDDHADLRYHQVSLGYTLGIGTKADITAAKP